MSKRKVFIAVHQLNLGGVQKALISALDVIDYSKNEVTLYVRKNRLDLLDSVNKNVANIIVNQDDTKYYLKPYSLWLQLLMKILGALGKDISKIKQKYINYLLNKQMAYEVTNICPQFEDYDLAVSYIQNTTAEFVSKYVSAKRKVMFYHGSTDEAHELHEAIMGDFDRIYCVSEGALSSIKKLYPRFASKMSCLENYVNYKEIRQKANEFAPDYPKDRLVLCSCGRIAPVKGYDLAVEAADKLKKSGVKFVWCFVGDGTERQKIENMIAEKHLDDNIVITGLKNNPYPYIKNCDIFVQPSYEESQGLSMIEARILNSVVITTATAGGKAVVKDKTDGLIAEISSDSLYEKIIKLIKDKDLHEQIKKNLSEIDYSKDYLKFRNHWEKLLEDNL